MNWNQNLIFKNLRSKNSIFKRVSNPASEEAFKEMTIPNHLDEVKKKRRLIGSQKKQQNNCIRIHIIIDFLIKCRL